ncbi:DUF6781 family protein [Thauera propionica]|uniref:DUF6781 family protein n=1 Tax=Thauera propionica TaxID=2019431 RepID=UPI0023EFC1EA|nr:DUF6781 family protein [Thauera propionica]MDD3674970.1 hypothetical protein [Thauera propionica]
MTQDAQQIERDVQAAVEAEPARIAERVHAITLAALTRGVVDTQALREVTQAVLRGAQAAAPRVEAEHTEGLKEAVRGLDEALASAAQATQLAMQEAIGRSSEFSREGLKQSLDQLSRLEGDFVAALGDAARQASGTAQATLKDLAEHARSSGTAVGARVQSAVVDLGQAMGDLARAQVQEGMRALSAQTELLASMAAGVLRGFADRLHPDSSVAKDRRD